MIEKFLIKFFIALGEHLAAKGLIKAQEWIAYKERIGEAEDYSKVVDKPNSSREERRRAEDEFLG